MNYQQAWNFLDRLQFFKIKLGLDSMSRFLDLLGHPHLKLPFVHVAGTNGKGSVSVTLLTLLAGAGYKVGLYTSPHLSSVRERFRINDRYISRDDFAELATMIQNILDDGQITYFEFTTTLAMLWFARENVDLVILETGLGGRLDATNVVTPLVSVITNVSMDHEAYLGNTLEAVAREKAGIIKEGVPVISAVGLDESRDVVMQTCSEKQATLLLLDRDFYVEGEDRENFSYTGLTRHIRNLSCGMKGAHQLANTALCLATLEILAEKGFAVDDDSIRESLPMVFWPGRLEYFCLNNDGELNRCYLLDGAHNPAGVESLKKSLENDFVYRRLIMVWASMADKDLAGTLALIAPLCHIFIFCRPESERSATPEHLVALLSPGEQTEALCVDSVPKALDTAADLARVDDLICIAGSLYLVGAARSRLLGRIVD